MTTTLGLLGACEPLRFAFAACPLVAYLDPGTGSYALQLLLAGAFGGLFALKQSWQQCRAWLAQGPLARLFPAQGARSLD